VQPSTWGCVGTNGLQLAVSALEGSGLLGHETGSLGQAFRHVGQKCLHVKGSRGPSTLHDVISAKPSSP
jgi:hypothetical protein